MDTPTILSAVATLLVALAELGHVAFMFWREKRRDRTKRQL